MSACIVEISNTSAALGAQTRTVKEIWSADVALISAQGDESLVVETQKAVLAMSSITTPSDGNDIYLDYANSNSQSGGAEITHEEFSRLEADYLNN